MSARQFPVIEDLPEAEQQPFRDWLFHQTRPVNQDGSVGYYPWDYKIWKAKHITNFTEDTK